MRGTSEDKYYLKDVRNILKVLDTGDIVKISDILKQGFYINYLTLDGYATPLLHAISSRLEIKIIDLLIEAGADVNKGNHYATTPLIRAVERGRIDVAKLLIEKGADINLSMHWGRNEKCKDSFAGETALRLSVRHGLKEFVELFVQAGAKLHDDILFSALDFYRDSYKSYYFKENKNCYLEIIDILLKNGTDPHFINSKGKTIFSILGQDIFGIFYLILDNGYELGPAHCENCSEMLMKKRDNYFYVELKCRECKYLNCLAPSPMWFRDPNRGSALSLLKDIL